RSFEGFTIAGLAIACAIRLLDLLIPFRLDISAYEALFLLFSCPALVQLYSRHLCTVNLEKWYYSVAQSPIYSPA
ncbi:MAG: hypothetical protein OXT74_14360, partial [Candidatus Poribacteria bacterium]|nr:hypothetical protein [Candidatus Poribacteria bacterium]